MKNILIIAGNYEQFRQYIYTIIPKKTDFQISYGSLYLGNDHYIYGGCYKSIRGLLCSDIRFIGTYYDRDDIDIIKDQCR